MRVCNTQLTLIESLLQLSTARHFFYLRSGTFMPKLLSKYNLTSWIYDFELVKIENAELIIENES